METIFPPAESVDYPEVSFSNLIFGYNKMHHLSFLKPQQSNT